MNEQMHAVPIHRRAFIKETFINDLVADPAKLSKAQKPLILGDIIRWEYPDGVNKRGEITTFMREQNCYTTTCKHGQFEVIVGGVRQPDTNRLWCDLLGYVLLSADVVNLILPDVWLDCRIQIEMDSGTRLIRRSFAGVDSVPESNQHLVIGAPWNAHRPAFGMPLFYDSEDDIIGTSSKHTTIPAEAVNIIGIATSERKLFCPDEKWSKYEFIVPVLDQLRKFELGKVYKFSAFLSEIGSVYLVSNYAPLPNEPATRLTGQGNIWATVKCHDVYKSVWHSKKFGNLDDPLRLLAMYQFTRYASSSLTVGIEDATSSRGKNFRYRIVEFLNEKKEKVDNWMVDNEIKVDCNFAIFIDKDKAFSASYPEVIFYANPNETEDFEVGLRVKFTAVYSRELKKLIILVWAPIKRFDSKVPTVKKFIKDAGTSQWMFFVKTSVPRDFPEMLECEEFGLIDDRNVILEVKRPSSYNVWVTWAYEPKKEKYRLARTSFQVVREGEEEPQDKEGEPLVTIEGSMKNPSSRSNAPSEAGLSTHPQPQPPIERMATMSVENRVERADRGRDEEMEDSEVDEASASQAAMLRHSHVIELCQELADIFVAYQSKSVSIENILDCLYFRTEKVCETFDIQFTNKLYTKMLRKMCIIHLAFYFPRYFHYNPYAKMMSISDRALHKFASKKPVDVSDDGAGRMLSSLSPDRANGHSVATMIPPPGLSAAGPPSHPGQAQAQAKLLPAPSRFSLPQVPK
ncbi:hypothetical protein WR25_21166 [Diploscapter pachys]|uniref:Uncharacterized protein n=1 Tax=Diploscapter pachys TaxID=2018661 RepID=A0A2A2LE48_9BILA|nr:hypothetical protein WR25_21166 [Diploscapter pachys]